jgi:D-sedoheptulose 7-phosphate isomerase
MNTLHEYIADLQDTLDRLPLDKIEEGIQLLIEARLYQKQIFIMGNGGSAATASHFVCDLLKGARQTGLPPFRAISLNDSIPLMLAFSNDEGYETVFANQLAVLANPGDIVICISASGNSKNILRAVEAAEQASAITIGFTGFDGGKLSSMVNLNIHIPSNCIEQVEDIHLMLEHMICTALREESRYLRFSRETLS